MLYIVSTPIGNLEDITLRALRVLKEVSLVVAEDTRKAKNLCIRYDIKTRILSYHDYNKKTVTPKIIKILNEEKDVALISEAGTPGISDPGYFIIRECVNQNIPFTALPGASAATNALVLSGLATDSFFFLGFLSPKTGKRKQQLVEASKTETTLIVFESKYKVNKTLEAIGECFPGKKISVIREMTKIYEEVMRGSSEEMVESIKKKKAKGEYVICIDNR